MRRPAKKTRPVIKFKHPVDVEVYKSGFELFESVRQLDIAKLARSARAEIEVGYIKTDSCRRIVRAVIRKGMVTALKIDSSDDKRAPSSPELTRLLNEVQRKAPGIPERPPRLPVSVATFMADPGGFASETIYCWSICLYGHCLICCKIESTGQWMCSTNGFTIKPPKRQ